ncbi:hypothetical protein ACFFX0_32775 [Citricoccus parietis]|uniref:Uncharacterized protein n=1 Tax=Citricoccus parietis TaxID=592307 RepID=A0ABV5G8D6_9MICC
MSSWGGRRRHENPPCAILPGLWIRTLDRGVEHPRGLGMWILSDLVSCAVNSVQ